MTVISVPFHLDEHLPDLELPLKADRTIAPDLPAGAPWERMAVLYEQVATEIAGTTAPLVLSGDCTTSLGVVAGLQRAGTDPALVWFDGHGDVQTPETSASGYLGGMPVRQLVGGADRTVTERIGLRPVREEVVVLVDARDLDPPEAEYLAGSAIRRVPVEEVGHVLPDRPIYLHLDIDVVDPRTCRGCCSPRPTALDCPRSPWRSARCWPPAGWSRSGSRARGGRAAEATGSSPTSLVSSPLCTDIRNCRCCGA